MPPLTAQEYAAMLCGGVITSALECRLHDARLLSCRIDVVGTGVDARLMLGSNPEGRDLEEILPPQVAYLIDTSRHTGGGGSVAAAPAGLVIDDADPSVVAEVLDDEQALEYGFLHADVILHAHRAGRTHGLACIYRLVRELPEVGIWVSPESRGLGIGRALAAAVVARGAAGLPFLNWATLESNAGSRALVPTAAVVYEATIVTEGVPTTVS